MTRRVILYPGEDGYMIAEVPSLPGCVSQGKTRDEALANIQEAIALHVEVLQERTDIPRHPDLGIRRVARIEKSVPVLEEPRKLGQIGGAGDGVNGHTVGGNAPMEAGPGTGPLRGQACHEVVKGF